MIGALFFLVCALCNWAAAAQQAGEAHAFVARNVFQRTDSAATHARLLLSITEFQVAWQQAWRESEQVRERAVGMRAYNPRRSAMAHCHPDGAPEGTVATKLDGVADSIRRRSTENTIIKGRSTYFAACPSWLLELTPAALQDEDAAPDVVLSESVRRRIVGLRAALIQQLANAGAEWPRDGWISAQQIRFRFDQGDADGALSAAKSCAAEPWWCNALVGYSNARRGEVQAAELAFAQMEQLMSPVQRCRWDDLSAIMPEVDRRPYVATRCDARAVLNSRFWWMADPLFRVSGNERLVDHQMRRVETTIRRMMAQDERHSWSDQFGGDALESMVLRYGKPTLSVWLGDSTDAEHSVAYLEKRGSPRAAPYTTFEYSRDRVHTLPTWQAVLNPFSAAENSWRLSVDNANGDISSDWWPFEHFRPRRRLLQFAEGQVTLLRRQSQAVVAAAVQLSHPSLSAQAAFDVLMLSASAPTQLDSLAQTLAANGATVALRGVIPALPTIIAIEAQGIRAAEADVRARFGITPPLPLDSMRPGELALSDPALLDTQDGKVNISEPDESLLDHMLGTLHIDRNHRRIGLYWESYGVSASDTVTVSVRISADAELSAARRIGMALNVADNPNRTITQRWQEPDANRGTRTLEGSVPVQQRTLGLNLSQLDPGAYVLEVSIQRPNGKIGTGKRRIVVDP